MKISVLTLSGMHVASVAYIIYKHIFIVLLFTCQFYIYHFIFCFQAERSWFTCFQCARHDFICIHRNNDHIDACHFKSTTS